MSTRDVGLAAHAGINNRQKIAGRAQHNSQSQNKAITMRGRNQPKTPTHTPSTRILAGRVMVLGYVSNKSFTPYPQGT